MYDKVRKSSKCPQGPRKQYPTDKYITCHCGYISSIKIGQSLLLYIPPDGIKCPQCGCVLIHVSGVTWRN